MTETVRNPQSPIRNDTDLLETIVAATRRIVEVRQAAEPLAVLAERVAAAPVRAAAFYGALAGFDAVNVIAECKRRSPSKGLWPCQELSDRLNASSVPSLGGTSVIMSSRLEPERRRRMRKDFIVSEYQLLEAKAAGADAVLLIVAALRPAELKVLHDHAVRHGLDALVEVHDARELAIAVDVGARIVGVNNRNLRTLEVDVHASEELIAQIPRDVVAVSESGLGSADDIARLRALGYRAFLIGERLMSAPDPGLAVKGLLEGNVTRKDTKVTRIRLADHR